MELLVFSQGVVATWPDLKKKHTTICFATLFDCLNFTGGASTWEDPHSRLLCCVRIVLKDSSFMASYNVQDATRKSSTECLQHMSAPFKSSSFLLFIEVVRGQTWTTIRDTKTTMENCPHFLIKCPVYLVSLHAIFWGLPWSATLPQLFSTVSAITVNGCRLPVSVVQTEILCTI